MTRMGRVSRGVGEATSVRVVCSLRRPEAGRQRRARDPPGLRDGHAHTWMRCPAFVAASCLRQRSLAILPCSSLRKRSMSPGAIVSERQASRTWRSPALSSSTKAWPATATRRAPPRAASCSPPSKHSITGAPSALPTSALAMRIRRGSSTPAQGTPTRRKPAASVLHGRVGAGRDDFKRGRHVHRASSRSDQPLQRVCLTGLDLSLRVVW